MIALKFFQSDSLIYKFDVLQTDLYTWQNDAIRKALEKNQSCTTGQLIFNSCKIRYQLVSLVTWPILAKTCFSRFHVSSI